MNSTTGEGGKLYSLISSYPCRLFSLAEIKSATKNFDYELVIGEGGFGKVYKGQMSIEEGGHVVAIKRLDSMSNQGELEFRAEIDMLSTLHHCNLVSLIGYCHDKKEMILVYKYMPNGTLYHHLHKADTLLDWLTRLKIAIGAARGLDYLHTGVGTLHGVIHRDVKTSNILIDENWAAMISDFGLSKIGPTNQLVSYIEASVKGTFGYLDPEYFYTRKLTRKTDVYAFGVVLFELLSGRLPVDERNIEEECSLLRWAQKCVKERKFEQMVDSKLKGTISPKVVKRFAQIGNRCLHSNPKERPTMTEVVASLQALLELNEISNQYSKSSGIMGFNWKVHKYFVSTTKPVAHIGNRYVHSVPKERPTVTEVVDSLQALQEVNEICDQSSKSSGIMDLDWNVHKYFDSTIEPVAMSKENFEDLLHSGAIAQLPLGSKVKVLVGIAQRIVFFQNLEEGNMLKFIEFQLNRSMIWVDKNFTTTLSGPFEMYLSDYEHGRLLLKLNLSGYKVIFVEGITGKRIYSSNRIVKIDRLFSQCRKKSLVHIAELCFRYCNEVDLESKMLTMLKEHDELIKERLESWLDDPNN